MVGLSCILHTPGGSPRSPDPMETLVENGPSRKKNSFLILKEPLHDVSTLVHLLLLSSRPGGAVLEEGKDPQVPAKRLY